MTVLKHHQKERTLAAEFKAAGGAVVFPFEVIEVLSQSQPDFPISFPWNWTSPSAHYLQILRNWSNKTKQARYQIYTS